MILLVMDQEHPRPLKSIEIYTQLQRSAKPRWQFPDPDHLNDDLKENLKELVWIFDALKTEGDRYAFASLEASPNDRQRRPWRPLL